MGLTVELLDEASLSLELHEGLQRLLASCFPDEAPFKSRDYCRAAPHQRVVLRDDEEPVGQVAVHLRLVGCADQEFLLGILADVAVDHRHRRQGNMRGMIDLAHQCLRAQDIDFSILFTDTPRVYESSGYSLMANDMRFWDVALPEPRWRTLNYRGSMYCELGDSPWPSGVIDLRGTTL